MTGAPIQPKLGILDGIADAFGPIFGTNFPVYNAANVLVGHVNGVADLAAGNINFLGASYPPSQLQVVDFWGMLQPAGAYLASKGVAPSWSDDAFVSLAPIGQSPVDLLLQPASADQWSESIGDTVQGAETAVGDAIGGAAANVTAGATTAASGALTALEPWLLGGAALLIVLAVRRAR